VLRTSGHRIYLKYFTIEYATYTFSFMSTVQLPDDGGNHWPKHVAMNIKCNILVRCLNVIHKKKLKD